VIGRIIGPWGIKGDVRVFVETDFPERFGQTREVLLGDDLTPYRVERGRPHGRVALLKLEGIETPEAAETLRGQVVQVPMSDAVPLPEGVWYWHDLLGIEVWTSAGERVGTLAQILETAGNDVYVVRRDGKEVLIPAIESVVKSVDLEARRMVIEPIPGMIE